MPLPTFLIIGAAKSATTSLWRYCGEHPQVFMSRIKECNFFSHGDPDLERAPDARAFEVTTLEEYRRLFDDVRDEVAIGEASPTYLRSPAAPARIERLLPAARFVVSLREPAARAYSAYLMHVRQGRAPLDPGSTLSRDSLPFKAGMYFEALKRYYDRFGRDRIHVCLFDDLSADPAGTMAAIFRFMGVDDTFRPDVETRHNAGALPKGGWIARIVHPISRNGLGQHLPDWMHRAGRRLLLQPKPACPPELLASLRRAYRDDVLRVQELTRRDLSAWLT